MADNASNKSTNAITESVVALNQLVLGSAPSSAMASMYVAMSHAAGVGAQNSVTSQQHLNILGSAALAAGTGNLLWEGLTRQVDNITMNDRLKYWQQMMSISSGQNPPTEEGDAAGAKKEDANKTSENDDSGETKQEG